MHSQHTNLQLYQLHRFSRERQSWQTIQHIKGKLRKMATTALCCILKRACVNGAIIVALTSNMAATMNKI